MATEELPGVDLGRRSFLCALGAAAAYLVVEKSLPKVLSGPQTIEIYPSGDPEIDRQVIQEAIDKVPAGSTIIMKSRNRYGDPVVCLLQGAP